MLEYAVWNQDHTEVSWYTVQMSAYGQQTWDIQPMNMYLYDGLAGMLLLIYCLKNIDRRNVIIELYKTLQKMLFKYTEKGCDSLNNLQSKNTGVYEGECSIIYTYLMLYQSSKEKIYLDYIKMHVRIVQQLIEDDQKYDLLTGNAGAIQIFLMLYEFFGDKKYLNLAERAAIILKESAEEQEYGIGWSVEKGVPPMAGMAHGNSGILMAIIYLWTLTKKSKYEWLAGKIWEYEESLYNLKINNWNDVRLETQSSDNIGAVAWCHGASGILLSRINCYRKVEDLKWKERLRIDIMRAYQKLKMYWKRDSWSLCHGICGNLWILEKGTEFLGNQEIECNQFWGKEEIELLPQEKMNPGLFNGYGGILYYMLREYGINIPDIFELSWNP